MTADRSIPFAPLGRSLARIGLGTANFDVSRRDAAFAVLDAWLELGGDVIDSAARYGLGAAESVLGAWLAARGTRGLVVLLTKGGHPDPAWRSRLSPEAVTADLSGSLERLGTDALDIFMLHRDDPDIPVGELVDVLHEQVIAGRARSVGVSNWTVGRLEAAIADARARGRTPITSSSVYAGLASWREPPWPGCVDALDDLSRAWYGRPEAPPNFAWSAQSGGAFAADFDPARAAPEVVAGWDTPDTAARRLRARALGRELEVTAAQVALAYVLAGPGSTVALVGARDVAALRAAWETLDLTLSPEQCRWLERGDG